MKNDNSLGLPNSTNPYSLNNLQTDLNNYLKEYKKLINIYGEFNLETKSLGQGGTSMVKGFIFNEKEYAIKFLSENIKDNDSKSFKRFKQAHLNLNSLNLSTVIPQLHMDKLEINKELTVPYIIIMEKADKTLKQYISEKRNDGSLNHIEINKILKNLYLIINEIHQHGIIHRDIKPENIFYYKNSFVLGDFDIASFDEDRYIKLHDTKDGERLANAYCSAPEQFIKGSKITQATDLYALGQIIHWLITGNYLKGQSSISYPPEYDIYKNIVRKLLNENPKYRFQSIKEIIDYIENNKKPSVEEEIYTFDEFVNKYTFNIHERPKFVNYNTYDEIKEITDDLNEVGKITELEYQEGYSNMPFYNLLTIDEKNLIYRTDRLAMEFKIKSIYFFKHYYDFGDSLIIIETENLEKAIEDSYSNTECQMQR